MNTINNSDIRAADIVFAIGVVFLLAAHFITSVAIWMMTDYATDAKDVARAYESNPLAVDLIQGLTGTKFMLVYIVHPAILFTIYYLMRRKYIQASPIIILFIAYFTFFAGLANVLNDAGNLVGLMWQRGLI